MDNIKDLEDVTMNVINESIFGYSSVPFADVRVRQSLKCIEDAVDSIKKAIDIISTKKGHGMVQSAVEMLEYLIRQPHSGERPSPLLKAYRLIQSSTPVLNVDMK